VSGIGPGMASTRDGRELDDFIADVERLEQVIAAWDETARDAVDAYRRALDAMHGAALRKLIKILRQEPHALAALKAAVEDPFVHAVLRYHALVKPSLNERIETALDSVRPMLASHGGDVELVAIHPPRIDVRFMGTCDSCAASTLTFHAGVKKAVQEMCPEITDVVQANGGGAKSTALSSPFAVGGGGSWRPAGTLAEIPDGGVRTLNLDRVPVFLFRRGIVVVCFRDACGHLGAPLSHGKIEAGILTCPHHGFRYDLDTGACLTAPDVALQPQAVRILGARIEVRIAS
jgi:Fe-S cluster biogenesis protein NfuA/nitrite reductase/ring-hydroxylating ferredoxin subunit